MPKADRNYDTTRLNLDWAEERLILHRDYVAHCFRWSAVVKLLMKGARYKNEILLDVGCGVEMPLPRLMYSNRITDFAYIGVDMNPLVMHKTIKQAVDNSRVEVQLFGERDAGLITEKELEFMPPTLCTMFEVAEHVQPRILIRLLKNVYKLIAHNADFLCSTPCFDGTHANNHINEMSYSTFGWVLEQCGFTIQNKYGTFASKAVVKPAVDKDYPGIYEKLGEFYDSNIMSNIFAPLYPDKSRNVMWFCKKTGVPSKLFLTPGSANQNPSWPAIFNEMETNNAYR